MSIFSFLFKGKSTPVETRSPGEILLDDQLAAMQAKEVKMEAMQEYAKKAALIHQLAAKVAAFDAASIALRVAEDLAEAEDLAAKADINFGIFDDFMADPHSAIAAVKAAKAAKNKKTNP